MDPEIAFAHAAVMSDRVALSIAPQRFRSTLLGALGAMALLLAVIGVWSLASSRVARQTREIGIRMSLGLSPVRARTNVVAGALLIGFVGVATGSAISLACARFVDTALFGVPRIDAITLLGVAVFLLGLTASASLRPATRASGVDPLAAIRSA